MKPLRSSGTRKPFLCRVLLLLLIGSALQGESGHAQEAALFRLRGWGGLFGFRFEEQRGFAPQFNRRPIFHESLLLRNNGFVVSPWILHFRWTADVALSQERYIDEHLRQNSKGRFLSQNLTASLFRNSRYPATLGWNQSNNTVAMSYGGSTTYDIRTLFASLSMQGLFLPSRLRVEQRDVKDEWTRGGWTVARNQVQRRVQFNGRRNGKNASLQFDYNLLGIHDRYATGQNYITHNGNLRFRHSFGKDQGSVWDSSFRLYSREGIVPYRVVSTTHSLKLQHIPQLSTHYRYSLSAQRTAGQNSVLNVANVSLNHRLYQSLTTNLGANGTYGAIPHGKEHAYSFYGGTNYTKRIPFSGRLQISYGRAYSLEDRQVHGMVSAVAQEHHLFVGGFPMILAERNIIVSTITVFNERGDIIFEQGQDRDYIIRISGDQVEIYRNLLGRIDEGQTVLVEYHYRTSPSMRYTTNMTNVNAGLFFGWLSLYYRINRHDQTLLLGSAQSASFLEDLFVKTTGVEVAGRRTNAGVSFQAAYKLYDSSSLAYESVDVRQTFFVKPVSSVTLTTNFTTSLLKHLHTPRDGHIRIHNARSEFRWYPTDSFSLLGFGGLRIRRETGMASETNFEFGIRLQRLWRVLRFEFSFERQRWEFGPRLIDVHRLMAKVERVF